MEIETGATMTIDDQQASSLLQTSSKDTTCTEHKMSKETIELRRYVMQHKFNFLTLAS